MSAQPAAAQLCPFCEEADMAAGKCPACGYFPLQGDGDVTYIKRTARRQLCNCGNLATKRHTYLLEGGRANPRSSSYRGDDVSWCSDHEELTCEKCKRPTVDGYQPCSTFSITPDNSRFAHLFRLQKDEPFPLGASAADLNAFAQLVARMLLDGEDQEGRPYEQSDEDARDTLASLIEKARALTGIEGPGKPVCNNFQSDGRGCCRHCDHFHGPDGSA